MGLKRDVSGESSVSQRRPSVDTEKEPTAVPQDKPTAVASDTPKPFRTNVVAETIPESPQKDNAVNGTPLKKAQEIPAPKVATPIERRSKIDLTTQKPTPNETKQQPAPAPVEEKPKTNGLASSVKPQKTEPAKRQTAEVVKSQKVETAKLPTNGPTNGPANGPVNGLTKAAIPKEPSKLAVRTSSVAATKPSTKSPTVPKTPTSPLKAEQKLPAKTPDKSATPAAATRTPKQPTSTTKPAASSSGPKAKPAPVQLSPAYDRGIGFVKPKPRSPTRPVRLPAGLMAQTASSVSKVKDPPRESLSRMSGNVLTVQSLGRAPSRGGASATADPSLRRQRSTISRSRSSFGPPPKKQAQDHPVTKREREVDEGFLARMMRPTQSSSSKTADKAPVTPPRKLAPVRRSLTNEGEGSAKRDSSVKVVPALKTAASQPNGLHAPPTPDASSEAASTKNLEPETPVISSAETESSGSVQHTPEKLSKPLSADPEVEAPLAQEPQEAIAVDESDHSAVAENRKASPATADVANSPESSP